jgi:phosphoenolpyruvate carboxylase
LGAELSLDDRIVQVSEAARRMIEASPDRSPQRQYEFYRRAMSGIYTRLAATAQALDGVEAPRHALGAAPADRVKMRSGASTPARPVASRKRTPRRDRDG